jgi:alpha-aminoadipate/glutamate carrier protein LysW
MVICPVCDAEIDVEEDDLEEEDTLSCDECGADLHVVSVDPPVLEPLEEDDEDEEAPDFEDEDEEDENWK